MIKKLKALWDPPDPFFELDEKRDYSNEELFEILRTKLLRVGTGTHITLKILERLDNGVRVLFKNSDLTKNYMEMQTGQNDLIWMRGTDVMKIIEELTKRIEKLEGKNDSPI